MAHHTRLEPDFGLYYLPVLYNLADTERREGLCHVQVKRVVGKQSTWADSSSETEDVVVRVRSWFVCVCFEESLWVENHGVGVHGWIVGEVPKLRVSSFPRGIQWLGVKDLPNIGEYHGTLGNEVALIFVVFGASMGKTHGRNGVPAQNLLDGGFDIGEVLAISERGKSIASNYRVDFLLCLLLYFWKHSHREEEARNRRYGLQVLITGSRSV